MLEILMISSFLILGLYSSWYFFKAKTYQPLNLDDLALIWKTHKQQTGCNAKKIDKILLKKNQIVGYTCTCGKKYYQKRLITQKPHTHQKNKSTSTTATRFIGINDLTDSMNEVGIICSGYKQV